MKKFWGFITALVFVLSIGMGCQGSSVEDNLSSSVASTAPGYSNFRMLLSDEPNAIEDFLTVMVTITNIGLHQGGESGEWIEPEDFEPWIGDLRLLIGTNASAIWAGQIPPGEYDKAFIYVEDISATPVSGTAPTIKIPSGKLQISKPFTVTADGAIVDFVFDITIIEAGNSGQYIVKPQIGESGAHQEFREIEQNGRGPQKEPKFLKGTIAAMNDTTNIWVVLIGDQELTVNVASAEVKGVPGVGFKVKAEGTLAEDGVFTASAIHVLGAEDADDNDAGEVEFEGTVSQVLPTLVIAGYTIITDGATILKGNLIAGVSAEVEGTLQADGTVLARKIEVEDEAGTAGGPKDKENKENQGNGNNK
jgi:hypothetical protein